ncbi:cytochrome P450 [Acrocarpospora catenulata]|uniref:cytochrome P450 n=1 Tax=Acrocarpospora catenulata TaxID=2836182 RepID=UPI001BDA218F|nr:cytochrome P450 [Acrocarpospora catenulata]
MSETVLPDNPTDLDDLLSPEAIDRPFQYYRRLRETRSVYWNKRWNGWIVTGYPEVVEGFRSHTKLSSDRFSGPFGEDLSEASSQYQQLFRLLSKIFVWKDPPYHTRMRKLVNKAFTPRSVEVLRPRIQELVSSLIEPIRGQQEVDFFARFAFTLPVVVIAEYLGVPAEARESVRKWSEDLGAVIFVRGNDTDRMRKGEQAMHDLAEFLKPIIAERRRDPREDLISGMVQAADGGDAFTDDEVVANAILMVFAGHETTMNLLANGMVAFDEFPDQWARLRADPTLARSAVDEVLRFDGPIRAQARWAKEPLELAGQRIEVGDRVLLVQHAANRDPAGFTDPERLDIARRPNKHTAFGQGIHTCLGAPLARLEAEEAFRGLSQAFPRYTIHEQELHYAPTVVSRSLTQLHVTFYES